ncbi:MAG: MFS transporter [Suipraeoptans sp.]
MSEKNVQYRQAKAWQLALVPAANCVPTLFVILMTFASYVAVGVYGATTVLAGTIITGTRMFDAITDPIIGLFADRLNGKLGRARPLMVIGYVIISLAALSMFRLGLGGGEGRVWVFALIYVVYIIGYTLFGVGAGLNAPIITNDPKQRPILARWQTVYITVLSSLFSIILASTLMPRHNYQMGLPLFSELSIIVIVAAGVLVAITFFAVTVSKTDVPASYVGTTKEKVKFKDMVDLLLHNRAMQMYTIAAASDKLAMQTASNSVIVVMLFGIVIGNYSFNSEISIINMVVTLVLLIFFVSRMAGKSGFKKALTQWTIVSIILYVAMFVFMFAVDTLQITTNPVLKILFIVLFVACGAAKTACSCVTEPTRYDVIDYELSRSGRYMPAVVGTAYSFIDKLVSSLSTTIVAVIVAMIGYTDAMPQATDPLTGPLFGVTMFLWLGIPILGWICTLIAMKFYPLNKETMVEVQQKNHEIRTKAETI